MSLLEASSTEVQGESISGTVSAFRVSSQKPLLKERNKRLHLSRISVDGLLEGWLSSSWPWVRGRKNGEGLDSCGAAHFPRFPSCRQHQG